MPLTMSSWLERNTASKALVGVGGESLQRATVTGTISSEEQVTIATWH